MAKTRRQAEDRRGFPNHTKGKSNPKNGEWVKLNAYIEIATKERVDDVAEAARRLGINVDSSDLVNAALQDWIPRWKSMLEEDPAPG